MKRVYSAPTIFACAVAMGWAATARADIKSLQVQNNLDDNCNIFVNGAFAGAVPAFQTSPLIVVGPAVIPGRTTVKLRCSDGGEYTNSVEDIFTFCLFTVDEDGSGLRKVSCTV